MNEFPDKKMSRSRLQRIYKNLKIKRKKIKLSKNFNNKLRKRINKATRIAKDELSYYINKGFRIIYLDEVMITKSTIPTHEYHLPYQRVNINQQALNDRAIATIVGVS